MDEWDDDVCCNTCRYGEPEEFEECVYCGLKGVYMPDDGACSNHEY